MDHRNVPPATTLLEAYRACSLEPLPPVHAWYVDLGPAREGNLGATMERRFREKPNPAVDSTVLEVWPKLLLLGMRGSGKSTELNALAAVLRDHFEVVKIEVDAELNAEEFDVTELLLAIAVGVERHLREVVQQPLPPRLLADIQTWFATVTKESVRERIAAAELGLQASVPEAPRFFFSVLATLKSSATERERMVAQLRRFPGELVTLCNSLLGGASTALGAERELLVILDNLDRYRPEVVDRVLGGGADRLVALRVCMLLTPPVDLLIRPLGQPLTHIYAHEVMHVPAGPRLVGGTGGPRPAGNDRALGSRSPSRGPADHGPQKRAMHLVQRANAHLAANELADSLRLTEEARTELERIGDATGLGLALTQLGVIHHERGRSTEARHRLEQALDVFERYGDEVNRALALVPLALVRRDEGDLPDAVRLTEEALGTFERIGAAPLQALALSQLARLRRDEGRLLEALHLTEDAMARFERLGDAVNRALALVDLAGLYARFIPPSGRLPADVGSPAQVHAVLGAAALAARDLGAEATADHLEQAAARLERFHPELLVPE